jgi:hypothetical protein
MRRDRLLALALAAALGASSMQARADDALEKARILFNAGAQAYAAGRFDDAVTALAEAYALAPRPQVVFSLAQAERRQYSASQDPRALHDAIQHFRKYLEMVPEGGRRGDAVEALGELEAIAAGLAQPGAPAAQPRKEAPTRVMISTPTPGAVITLDGKPHDEPPVLETVKPGKHLVRVSAPGFIEEQRELLAVEGALVPVSITLREQPSYLSLTAPRGASIAIDGRPYGRAPLQTKIELARGKHLVTVTQTGHEPRVEAIRIERGQTFALPVTLWRTRQRFVSYALLGSAAAGALGGGVLALGALHQQNICQHILSAGAAGNISPDQLAEYDAARKSRDFSRGASLLTFGVAGALGISALATYIWDDPALPAPAPSVGVTALSLRPGEGFIGIGGRF